MEKDKTKKKIGFALRFPNAKLRDDVKKLAQSQKRSMNSFIVIVLDDLVKNSRIPRVVEKTRNL